MGEVLDPDAELDELEMEEEIQQEAEALQQHMQQAHMQLVQDMMAVHGEGSEEGSVDGVMDGSALDSGDEYGGGEGVNYLEAMMVEGEGEEGSVGLDSGAAASQNAEHGNQQQQQQEQHSIGAASSDHPPPPAPAAAEAAAAAAAAGANGAIPTPRVAAPFPPCTPHPILPAHAPEVSTALGWYPSHQQQQQQRGSLAVRLQLPRLAQLVCVKLLDSEDVSPAFNESRGGCNIDCEVVIMRGQDLGGLVGQRGVRLLGAACRG
jgi:hypothetical protein